eukprot:6466684-Ditylum_brightwellii.AAC.1
MEIVTNVERKDSMLTSVPIKVARGSRKSATMSEERDTKRQIVGKKKAICERGLHNRAILGKSAFYSHQMHMVEACGAMSILKTHIIKV